MARDLYPFNDIPSLLIIRQKLIDQRLNGNVIDLQIGGMQGVRTRRDALKKGQSVEQMLYDIDYSLWKRAFDSGDQDVMALYPHPGRQKISRTKPNYHGFAAS